MDTITHGIVGALVGKAFFAGADEPASFTPGATSTALSSRTAKAAIVACTIGSTFPDIDVFAGPLAKNPLAIMEWHRNITHSLVMLPVWALLLAAVSLPLARWLRWQAPPFWKLAGIYAAGLLSHVFLDVATNFGTMIWSPLKYSRVSWDWLFIVDSTFSGIALVPQLAAWCYREPAKFAWRAGAIWAALSAGVVGVYRLAETSGFGFPAWVAGGACALMAALFFAPRIRGAGFGRKRATWARAAMAVLCVYVVCAAMAHRSALARAAEFASSRHLRVESVAALPLPPTLTHWAGVITTPEGVWRATFHLPGGKLESAELYARSGSDRYIAEAKSLRDVQVYLWFARFPIWHVERVRGETMAEVTDLRFFRQNLPSWNSESRAAGPGTQAQSNLPGFTFQIIFDAAGNVISHGFRRAE
jgi:membrane-bound metal-dependent hydrolase YbcI (DUF457 family)